MQRESALKNWLAQCYPQQNFTLSFAAADADFRRYFRATFADGSSVICMDAPPDKMNTEPYVRIQKLFSMLNVPQILHYDAAQGFMVLNDLGDIQYLKAMQHENTPEAHKALLLEAIDELIILQKASVAGCLPEYDHEILLREVNLFPEWFVAKELGRELNFAQRKLWQQTLDVLLPAEFTLDIVIRYWEKARAAGLPVPAEFDTFYRWYEWTGVQRHLKVAGIFARLWHRDGKDKYRPEIPRFLNYLRRTSRRYVELAPLYALLLELVGDEELQTGYTF